MEDPVMTRRDLGALAAPIFPPPWADSLRDALGWNRRTCERLGTPKMPLDERRAELVATLLADDSKAHHEAARSLSDAIFHRLTEYRES